MSIIHRLCIAELEDRAFLRGRQVAHLQQQIAEIEAELAERGGGNEPAEPSLGSIRKVEAP